MLEQSCLMLGTIQSALIQTYSSMVKSHLLKFRF